MGQWSSPFTRSWSGSELQTQLCYMGGRKELSHIPPLHSHQLTIVIIIIRHEAISRSVPLLRSFARTVYPPLAPGPSSSTAARVVRKLSSLSTSNKRRFQIHKRDVQRLLDSLWISANKRNAKIASSVERQQVNWWGRRCFRSRGSSLARRTCANTLPGTDRRVIGL